jgi:exodeoxyribonuclease VII large subunit
VAGLASRLAGLQARAAAASTRALADATARLVAPRTRWLRARPRLRADALTNRLGRLAALGDTLIGSRRLRLQPLAARLNTLDPGAVLSRGYAIALDPRGRAVTSAQALTAGDRLRLVLAEGSAGVQVESIDPKGHDGGTGGT